MDGYLASIQPDRGTAVIKLEGVTFPEKRDVFRVERKGQVIGEVLVLSVTRGRVTVMPKASCAPLKVGDAVHLSRRATAISRGQTAAQASFAVSGPAGPGGTVPAGWVRFTVPGQGCSVMMPGTPRAIPAPTPGGSSTSYACQDPTSKVLYVVMSQAMPKEIQGLDKAELIQTLLTTTQADSIITSMSGSAVKGKSHFDVGGLAGVEYQCSKEDVAMSIGLLLGENRMYYLGVFYPVSSQGSSFTTPYYASFQLSD